MVVVEVLGAAGVRPLHQQTAAVAVHVGEVSVVTIGVTAVVEVGVEGGLAGAIVVVEVEVGEGKAKPGTPSDLPSTMVELLTGVALVVRVILVRQHEVVVVRAPVKLLLPVEAAVLWLPQLLRLLRLVVKGQEARPPRGLVASTKHERNSPNRRLPRR